MSDTSLPDFVLLVLLLVIGYFAISSSSGEGGSNRIQERDMGGGVRCFFIEYGGAEALSCVK